jgi:hypothetical protein
VSRGVYIAGFSEDARGAMAARPDYFVWWYTAKSIALVASLTVAAYFAGKSSMLRKVTTR